MEVAVVGASSESSEGRLCTECRESRLGLHRAASQGHLGCVRASLAELGEDWPSRVDEYGNSALHAAALFGELGAVRLLLETAGGWVGSRNGFGETLAHLAAQRGRLELLKYLLGGPAQGAEELALMRDEKGCTVLHAAVLVGEEETARWLLQRFGSSLAVLPNHQMLTALHIAAGQGALELIRLLSRYDAALVHARDGNGATAAFYAVQGGSLECVRYLVEKARADVTAVTRRGQGLLHAAALGGQLRLVEWLSGRLEKGAVVAVTAEGATPAHCAAFAGHTAVLQLFAAWLGRSGLAKLVKARDARGNSLLHLATLNSHPHTIAFLLANGFSPTQKNKGGHSPIDIADAQNRPDLRHLLKNASKLKGKDKKSYKRRSMSTAPLSSSQPLYGALGGAGVYGSGPLVGSPVGSPVSSGPRSSGYGSAENVLPSLSPRATVSPAGAARDFGGSAAQGSQRRPALPQPRHHSQRRDDSRPGDAGLSGPAGRDGRDAARDGAAQAESWPAGGVLGPSRGRQSQRLPRSATPIRLAPAPPNWILKSQAQPPIALPPSPPPASPPLFLHHPLYLPPRAIRQSSPPASSSGTKERKGHQPYEKLSWREIRGQKEPGSAAGSSRQCRDSSEGSPRNSRSTPPIDSGYGFVKAVVADKTSGPKKPSPGLEAEGEYSVIESEAAGPPSPTQSNATSIATTTAEVETGRGGRSGALAEVPSTRPPPVPLHLDMGWMPAMEMGQRSASALNLSNDLLVPAGRGRLGPAASLQHLPQQPPQGLRDAERGSSAHRAGGGAKAHIRRKARPDAASPSGDSAVCGSRVSSILHSLAQAEPLPQTPAAAPRFPRALQGSARDINAQPRPQVSPLYYQGDDRDATRL